MTTCYLEAEKWAEDEAELAPDEAHHLLHVLRAEEGTELRVVDGEGHAARAELLRAHGSHAWIRLEERLEPAPLEPRRILVQAPARGQRMDWLLQKATEIGCHEIWPMMTERAVVKIAPGKDAAHKAARWQAIALAACKQSGNPWMPRIAAPRPFAECLAAAAGRPAVFGCLTRESVPVPDALRRFRAEGVREVLVFTGPEGDFTPGETEAMLAAGIVPVTLGPTVLRVETAALYALVAIACEWTASRPG